MVDLDFPTATRLKNELRLAILRHMEDRGISQGEVARRIGAQRTNVNQVLRARTSITIDLLIKIADSIGLQVDLRLKSKAKD